MKTKCIILALMMVMTLMLCACSGETTTSTASNSEIMAAAGKYVKKTFDTDNYSVRILEQSKDQCIAEITLVYEYSTYIETVVGQIELYKDKQSQSWQYISSSYQAKNREIDFSPLNGVWKAKYTHPSNYLTKNDIPYTFTFSNAGKVQVRDGIVSTTTIDVQHELDEIWESYLAPEWEASFSNGVDYESGRMEIVYKESGKYFLITFVETNVEKMFDSPAQLRIDERQIIFYDTLVARECRLYR